MRLFKRVLKNDFDLLSNNINKNEKHKKSRFKSALI